MPITAKFSREFYDKFGHEAVDELVNFLNGIDTGYRLELRELNDRNFARLDDRLERRMGQLGARIDGLDARIEGLDARIDGLDARVGALETRVGRLEVAVAALNGRMKAIENRLDTVDGRLDRLEGRVEAMDQKMTKQFYWIIGIQVAVLLSVVGTLSAALFLR